MPGNVHVIDHPLVQHKLTLLRRRETSTGEFRRLVREISTLMAYELTRDLPTASVAIDTPLEAMDAPLLAGKKLCFLSILRAGNGMLDGMLDQGNRLNRLRNDKAGEIGVVPPGSLAAEAD